MEGAETEGATSLELIYPYSYNRGLTSGSLFNRETIIRTIRTKVAPFRFRLAAKEVAEVLDIRKKDKVLEIGSGLGLLGKEIKEISGNETSYFGIDLYYSSSKSAQEKGLISTQADTLRLPFSNNSFDRIISTDVLEHIEDAETTVDEIKRVLKPEGKAFLVIADPSEGRFANVSGHITRNESGTDVLWWTNLFTRKGFKIETDRSRKFRDRDWRKLFNLPFLVSFKDKPGFACAFNPVHRPGVYVIKRD